MRSSLMNCMPSSVPSRSRDPDLLGRVTLFLNREIFGIKAVGVRSEWYSDGRRNRYRYRFGSGQSA
jgi:hypothetical protein